MLIMYDVRTMEDYWHNVLRKYQRINVLKGIKCTFCLLNDQVNVLALVSSVKEYTKMDYRCNNVSFTILIKS